MLSCFLNLNPASKVTTIEPLEISPRMLLHRYVQLKVIETQKLPTFFGDISQNSTSVRRPHLMKHRHLLHMIRVKGELGAHISQFTSSGLSDSNRCYSQFQKSRLEPKFQISCGLFDVRALAPWVEGSLCTDPKNINLGVNYSNELILKKGCVKERKPLQSHVLPVLCLPCDNFNWLYIKEVSSYWTSYIK
ncbi:hypothetical protein OROMI_001177 [Orobanche minor]